MKNIENNILNALIDKYERSKLSTTGTKNKRTIKLTTDDKPLDVYTFVDSYKYSEEYDAIIMALENKGFIKSKFVNDRFENLVLNLEAIDDIYTYLKRDNPSKELNKITETLNNYNFDNFLNGFINHCKNYIKEKGTFPKIYFNDATNLKLILDCFVSLFSLQKETKERDFSAKYLKDSKLFATIKSKIIKIIRDFDDCENLDDKEILANFNITQNTSYALIKNKLIAKINKQIINLNDFGYELSLSDEMIDDLEILPSDINKIITVENLTSFYSLKRDDALIVYLAGYHNHTKQKLLEKIYNIYPEANYYHYGDIDAGGFWIFVNLKQKTNIPFVPYNMDVKQLVDKKDNLKKLTANDRKRLEAELTDERFTVFHRVIEYMLTNNVKLEQENLDE